MLGNVPSRKRRDRGLSMEWADNMRSRKRRDRGDRLRALVDKAQLQAARRRRSTIDLRDALHA